MSRDGDWLSYSRAPVAGETFWQKSADTVCFRIPLMLVPKWSGEWQDSLTVFEGE